EAALLRFREVLPDLVVLDLNMPGMSGLETCRAIRETSEVPIIVLTVRREEEEKVEALDAGADDYVTKPFGKQELLARIRAALRRSPASATSGPRTLSTGDLEIDFETRKIRSGKKTVRLTPKEFDMLRYLVSHAGKPVLHRELLQAVWARTTETKPITCAFSSRTFGRRSNPIRQNPNTSLRNPGSVTVSAVKVL